MVLTEGVLPLLFTEGGWISKKLVLDPGPNHRVGKIS